MWLPPRTGSRPSQTRQTASKRRAASRPRVELLEDRNLMSFDPAANYAVGLTPTAITSGDFNADGCLDIAVANYGAGTMSVLLASTGGVPVDPRIELGGEGTFKEARTFATGAGPRSLAVGDLDGDGDLDLATANETGGTVSVLLGDGAGNFAAPLSLSVAPGGQTLSVAVGDIDADGKLDLVATSRQTTTHYVPGRWGSGWYGYGSYYYPGWSYTSSTGYVNVMLGNGGGSFDAPANYQLPASSPLGVAVADLSGDGKLDVVTVNSDRGTVSVLLNSGTGGTLGTPATYTTGWSPQAVTVGEFTGDGTVDLVTAGQTIDVLPGLGNGTFQSIRPVYVDPTSIIAADFNADGKLDVVTADPTSGVVSVLLGRANGTFALPIDFAAGSQPTAVTVGDFNRDGRADVAAANAGSANVSVFLNNGTWPDLAAPSLRIGDATVTEGNAGTATAAFTVTLSAAYDRDVTVRYATADGAWSPATAGSDYVAASGEVTILAGQTTATINVLVNGDRLAEDYEYFALNLSNATNAFIADRTGVGTIVDDEPRISIDSYASVTEGNTGTTAVTFKVRLSAAAEEEVRVNYSTFEGDTEWNGWSYYSGWYGGVYSYYSPPPPSASSVDDFLTQTNNTLVFARGETEKTITVLVNGDRFAEDYSEVFSVDLTGATGGVIASGHAVGTIVDDEPWVSIGSATVTEGNTGTVTATFTVTLSAAYDADVIVNYATQDGSAIAGTDYQAKSGQVTIRAGQTSATITVLVTGERVAEYAESFYVVLSSPTDVMPSGPASGRISNGWGYGTITDNDAHMSINDVQVQEGGSGTTTVLTFTVSLSAPSDGTVTVKYTTYDYYATAGSDYQAKSGTLTFAAGETSKTFTVVVLGDSTYEGNEYVQVGLSAQTGNVVIDDSWAMGTIMNDDAAPTSSGNGKGRKNR